MRIGLGNAGERFAGVPLARKWRNYHTRVTGLAEIRLR